MSKIYTVCVVGKSITDDDREDVIDSMQDRAPKGMRYELRKPYEQPDLAVVFKNGKQPDLMPFDDAKRDGFIKMKATNFTKKKKNRGK